MLNFQHFGYLVFVEAAPLFAAAEAEITRFSDLLHNESLFFY